MDDPEVLVHEKEKSFIEPIEARRSRESLGRQSMLTRGNDTASQPIVNCDNLCEIM